MEESENGKKDENKGRRERWSRGKAFLWLESGDQHPLWVFSTPGDEADAPTGFQSAHLINLH